MLGLNPLEQEVLDLTNEITRNGFIYFPEFCQIVTKKYREEDQEIFRQNMFKVGRITSTSFFKFKEMIKMLTELFCVPLFLLCSELSLLSEHFSPNVS